jgi:hypothetical protein
VDLGFEDIWDTQTGNLRATLTAPALIREVVFSVAIANDRLTRGFTDDECRQYLHLERCPQTT